MIFLKNKRSPFRESGAILSEEGFSDRYIEKLRQETAGLKNKTEIAQGENFIVNALILRGRLTEAYDEFRRCEEEDVWKKLDRNLYPNLLQNVIFSLFIRDKFKEAERIYKDYNEFVLKDKSDGMMRTLALHECMNERYENAVTVLAKLMDSECRFLDLCIVKTVLKLDMYDRAMELSADFGKYDGRYELESEAKKLKKKSL
ncbi:MAG: hypothetical protein IJ007_10270 [Oscillospiraceae bacterium]|nr:hypothetical protein [Oscillospiraceae bacterium]